MSGRAANLPCTASVLVIRVSGEAFVTDARPLMVVSHAERIGSTVHPAASIHTLFAKSVGKLDTDLVVATISCIGTLRDGGASNGSIVRIVSCKSWSAKTLTKVANSVRSTLGGSAQIITLLFILHCADLEWIPDKAKLAPTIVAARGVDADGVGSTDCGRTFINVNTSAVGVSSVSLGTDAGWLATSHGALGVESTFQGGAGFLHLLLASNVGVSSVSIITDTLVGSTVFTMAVRSASWRTGRWSHRWHAKEVSISNESLIADTLLGIWITPGIEATTLSAARFNTPARFTGLGPSWAGISGTAKDRSAGATWEGVPHHSLKTDTGGTLGTDNALGVVATNHVVALTDALASGLVLLGSSFASTPGGMTFRDADGIVTTWQGAARVDAHVGLTCQLTRTIFILATFSPGLSVTSTCVGVSSGSSWTLTLVTARFIQTPGISSTRVVTTLVNVFTSS